MKINTIHFLYAGAVLALVIGISLTVTTARQTASRSQSLRSKIATFEQLRALHQTQDRWEAAIQAFETLTNATPVSLSGLTAACVPNVTPEIREIESKALTRGWTVTRVEVIFNEINLGRIPAFLRAAESQRPPWRLTECSITASREADGFGRAVLILEALGKTR